MAGRRRDLEEGKKREILRIWNLEAFLSRLGAYWWSKRFLDKIFIATLLTVGDYKVILDLSNYKLILNLSPRNIYDLQFFLHSCKR